MSAASKASAAAAWAATAIAKGGVRALSEAWSAASEASAATVGARRDGQAQRLNTAAVQAVAKRLTNDRTPGRIETSEEQLPDMATAVAEAQADGINPRTGS